MTKYFKVYTDFANYLPIDSDEYEKAIYAFMKGLPVVFKNGAVTRIEKILPDYNKMLGWNSDYKPNPDDFSEVEQSKKIASLFTEKVKDKIEYLISTKQEHLIGKNVEIPELSAPKNPKLENLTGDLAEKMRVK